MSDYGYCPTCGAPGVTRERRLNGNDRCEKGHSYPSRSAVKTIEELCRPKPTTDSDYRNKLDGPMESLGVTLMNLGAVGSGDDGDSQLVEIAIKKLKMLHEIAATVLTPSLLKAAMAG